MRYSWLLTLCDVFIMVLGYLKMASDANFQSLDHLGMPHTWLFGLWQAATHVYIRSGVFALASAHLTIRRDMLQVREHTVDQRKELPLSWRSMCGGARILLSASVTVASGFFGYKVKQQLTTTSAHLNPPCTFSVCHRPFGCDRSSTRPSPKR